jgi:CheY-like chemotaxis protein
MFIIAWKNRGIDRCLEAGRNNYISKPVKLNELAKVVGKYQAFQVD